MRRSLLLAIAAPPVAVTLSCSAFASCRPSRKLAAAAFADDEGCDATEADLADLAILLRGTAEW
jgi:hypothetical protein